MILFWNQNIFTLVETWLKQDDTVPLVEACPTVFSFYQKARPIGRGGGLATIVGRAFDLNYDNIEGYLSFEILSFVDGGQFPTQIVVIYRPPRPNSFLDRRPLLNTCYQV